MRAFLVKLKNLGGKLRNMKIWGVILEIGKIGGIYISKPLYFTRILIINLNLDSHILSFVN